MARASTRPASPQASSTRCAPSRTGRWKRTPAKSSARQPTSTSGDGRGDRAGLRDAAAAKQTAAAAAADQTKVQETLAGVPLSSELPPFVATFHRPDGTYASTESRHPNGRSCDIKCPDVLRGRIRSGITCLRVGLAAGSHVARRRWRHSLRTCSRCSLSRRAAIDLASDAAVRERARERVLSGRRPQGMATRPPADRRQGGAASTGGRTPFRPARRRGWVGGGAFASLWMRGSAGPVVRPSLRDYPAERQVFVADSRQTSPQRGKTVRLRCYKVTNRCPSGGRGRWGGGGVRGRRRGWRCGRRGVGRR